MNFSSDALRARQLERSLHQPLPALFILEPHMHSAAAWVSSWGPVCTLQAMGGASRPSEERVQGTLAYALEVVGARSVVVCGEGASPPLPGPVTDPLLLTCRALGNDPVLGPLLQSKAVELEVLWFDTHQGDVHRYCPASRRFEVLSDAGVTQLLNDIDARAGLATVAA